MPEAPKTSIVDHYPHEPFAPVKTGVASPEKLTIAVDESDLAALCEAVQLGLESTQELLSIHDATIGRCRRHNRVTAEYLESQITRFKATIVFLTNLSTYASRN